MDAKQGPQGALSRQQLIGVSWSGPIPDPATLARYEQLIPGSAQRIFDRFETQSDHRMELERLIIAGEDRRANRGQWMALAIAVFGLAVAAFGFQTGHEVGGGVIGAGVLVDLAGLFIYGHRARRKERERKAERLQGAVS